MEVVDGAGERSDDQVRMRVSPLRRAERSVTWRPS